MNQIIMWIMAVGADKAGNTWDMENLFQRVDLSVTFASRILRR